MKTILMVFAVVVTAMMVSSCKPSGVRGGNEPLIIRILPQGEWTQCKVYLNDQFVDTAGPGADQREYKVATGRYNIRLETENFETNETTVTIVGGMGGRNYFEFRPKPLR